MRYALTQVNPTAPATGAGVVFTVSLRGKTPGETTLALGPVEMADRRGQTLPVTAEAGTIKVVAAEAPSATSRIFAGFARAGNGRGRASTFSDKRSHPGFRDPG